MTCIIALESKNDCAVYMGSDSAAAANWDIRQTASPKVFVNGEFLIGYSSSFRMGQLLQYGLTVRERAQGEDAIEYLVTGFIPAVRERLRDGGYTTVANNQESIGEFLVGYAGRVYRVDTDLHVARYADGIAAVGCGGRYARAALAALIDNTDIPPEQAVLKALEIAGRFSNGVCAPYRVDIQHAKLDRGDTNVKKSNSIS